MKKIYLPLALVGFVSMNALAQMPTFQKVAAKKDISLFSGDMKERKSPSSSAEQKVPGDIIWQNNFNTATNTNWAISAVGATQGPDFGWQLSPVATGANSIGSWAFANQRITSASGGGYAIVKNGDPQAGTQVANAEFIMMFDSTFNLSSFGNVDFKFQQYGALFIDKQVVEATVDGTNWVELGNNDDMGILSAGGGSPFPNPTNRTYSVTAAFPQGTDFSSVKFRFRVYWDGSAGANSGIMYGWFVDDVRLVEGQNNDLVMYQSFNAVGSVGLKYTKIPTEQASGGLNMSFGGIVKNAGALSQNATMTVANSGGTIGTSNPVAIAGFGRDSLVVAGPYAVPTTAGIYNFTHTVAGQNLENTGDDANTVNFEVTSNKIMAADAYNGTAASITSSFLGWQGGTGDAEIGTYFQIFNNASVGAVQIGISNVGSTQQAEYIGRTLIGKVYEVPADADPFLVDATAEYTVASGNFGQLVKAYFSQPLQLEAGKIYLVTASMFLDAEVPIAFSGFVQDGNTVGKDGENFVGLIANDIYGNVVECPVVRLDFTNYSSVEELTNQFGVNIYPNPVDASTQVAFTLNNETSVSIVVRDLTGREVATIAPQTFATGAHTIEVSTANMSAGVYNCTLTIGNTTLTKRIVKK